MSVFSSNANLTEDTWHHVSFTYNRFTSNVNLYVDGNVVGSSTDVTIDLTKSSEAFALGHDQDGSFFTGSMDEIKIYDRDLTTDEITNLYSSMTNNNDMFLKNQLVGHWTFDTFSSVADTFIDKSILGNNAITNAGNPVPGTEPSKGNTSIVFDGTTTLKAPSDTVNTNFLGVSTWIKPTQSTSTTILNKNDVFSFGIKDQLPNLQIGSASTNALKFNSAISQSITPLKRKHLTFEDQQSIESTNTNVVFQNNSYNTEIGATNVSLNGVDSSINVGTLGNSITDSDKITLGMWVNLQNLSTNKKMSLASINKGFEWFVQQDDSGNTQLNLYTYKQQDFSISSFKYNLGEDNAKVSIKLTTTEDKTFMAAIFTQQLDTTSISDMTNLKQVAIYPSTITGAVDEQTIDFTIDKVYMKNNSTGYPLYTVNKGFLYVAVIGGVMNEYTIKELDLSIHMGNMYSIGSNVKSHSLNAVSGTTLLNSSNGSSSIISGYYIDLPNGDKIHSSSTFQSSRAVSSLLDDHTNSWNNAWHGASGTTTMYAVYEFYGGAETIDSMLFSQVPGDSYYAGIVNIFYHNGTEFVEVTYKNTNAFVNTTYSESITVKFNPVSSTLFKIQVNKHSSNNTTYVGLSRWKLSGSNYAYNNQPHTFITSGNYLPFDAATILRNPSVFACKSPITHVYPPVVFKNTVDISNKTIVRSFIENNFSVINTENVPLYQIKQFSNTETSFAQTSIINANSVEVIDRNEFYNVVFMAVDENNIAGFYTMNSYLPSSKYWRLKVLSVANDATTKYVSGDNEANNVLRTVEISLAEQDGVHITPSSVIISNSTGTSKPIPQIQNNTYNSNTEQISTLWKDSSNVSIPMRDYFNIDYTFSTDKSIKQITFGSTSDSVHGFPIDMELYSSLDSVVWKKHSTISYNTGDLLDVNGDEVPVQIKFQYHKHIVKYLENEHRWYYDEIVAVGTHNATNDVTYSDTPLVNIDYVPTTFTSPHMFGSITKVNRNKDGLVIKGTVRADKVNNTSYFIIATMNDDLTREDIRSMVLGNAYDNVVIKGVVNAGETFQLDGMIVEKVLSNDNSTPVIASLVNLTNLHIYTTDDVINEDINTYVYDEIAQLKDVLVDKSVMFSTGTHSHLKTKDLFDLPNSGTNYPVGTISFYLKKTSNFVFTGDNTLVSFKGVTGHRFIAINASGINIGSGAAHGVNYTFNKDIWYHICVVFADTATKVDAQKIYINGTYYEPTDVTGNAVAVTKPYSNLFVGVYNNTTNVESPATNVMISNLQVFDTSLSTTNITDLYNNTLTEVTPFIDHDFKLTSLVSYNELKNKDSLDTKFNLISGVETNHIPINTDTVDKNAILFGSGKTDEYHLRTATYVAIPVSPSNRPVCTLSMWMNVMLDVSEITSEIQFAKFSGATGHRTMSINVSGTDVRVRIASGASYYQTFDFVPHTWFHVCIVFSDISTQVDGQKVFVNGVRLNSSISENVQTMTAPITELLINGGYNEGGYMLTDLKLYDIDLSSSEVTELYKNFTVSEKYPILHNKFDNVDPVTKNYIDKENVLYSLQQYYSATTVDSVPQEQPVVNEGPQINMSTRYSPFYEKFYITDINVLSSTANIAKVYKPLVFSKDYDTSILSYYDYAVSMSVPYTTYDVPQNTMLIIQDTEVTEVIMDTDGNTEPINKYTPYNVVMITEDSNSKVSVIPYIQNPSLNYDFGATNLTDRYRYYSGLRESSYITLSENFVANAARGDTFVDVFKLDENRTSYIQRISNGQYDSLSAQGMVCMNDNILTFKAGSNLYIFYRDQSRSISSQWVKLGYYPNCNADGYNADVFDNTFVYGGATLYIMSVFLNDLNEENPPTFTMLEYTNPENDPHNFNCPRIHGNTIVYSMSNGDIAVADRHTRILEFDGKTVTPVKSIAIPYSASVDIYENTLVTLPYSDNTYGTTMHVFERVNGVWGDDPVMSTSTDIVSGFGIHGMSIYENNIVLGNISTYKYALLFNKDQTGTWNPKPIQLEYYNTQNTDGPWVVKIHKNTVAIARTDIIDVYRTDLSTFVSYDSPSFPAPSSILTKITNAELVEQGISLTGSVVLDKSVAKPDAHYLLATTKPLTEDQARDFILNNPEHESVIKTLTEPEFSLEIEGYTYSSQAVDPKYKITTDSVFDADENKTPWILVMNYVNKEETNSTIESFVRKDTNGFPIMDQTFDSINVDDVSTFESEKTSVDIGGSFGHTGNNLFNKLCVALGSPPQPENNDSIYTNGLELRFLAKSSGTGNDRVVHWKHWDPKLLNELRYGDQAAAGNAFETQYYTLYDDLGTINRHTGIQTPDVFNYIFGDSGDNSMTNIGYKSNTTYWRYNYQEVDDWNSTDQIRSSVYQVWVRANKTPYNPKINKLITKVLDTSPVDPSNYNEIVPATALNYVNTYLFTTNNNTIYDDIDVVNVPVPLEEARNDDLLDTMKLVMSLDVSDSSDTSIVPDVSTYDNDMSIGSTDMNDTGLSYSRDSDGYYIEFDGVVSNSNRTYIDLQPKLFQNETSSDNKPFTFDIVFKIKDGYNYQIKDSLYSIMDTVNNNSSDRLYCIYLDSQNADGSAAFTTRFGDKSVGSTAGVDIPTGVIQRHTWVYTGSDIKIYINNVETFSGTGEEFYVHKDTLRAQINGESDFSNTNDTSFGRVPMKVYGVNIFQSALNTDQLAYLWNNNNSLKGIDSVPIARPHVTMPVTYFNNVTEKAIISGATVFSSVADIETVYPPVVFNKEGVDLTNTDLVKTFFETNITPLTGVAPIRFSVAQLDDFELSDVYTSLDNTDTEPITSDGMYQVGLLVIDKDGNVGLGQLKPGIELSSTFTSVSTLQTSITSAEFTDEGLVISGDVVADENNDTSFYAIATTKQLSSNTDVIGLFETYENNPDVRVESISSTIFTIDNIEIYFKYPSSSSTTEFVVTDGTTTTDLHIMEIQLFSENNWTGDLVPYTVDFIDLYSSNANFSNTADYGTGDTYQVLTKDWFETVMQDGNTNWSRWYGNFTTSYKKMFTLNPNGQQVGSFKLYVGRVKYAPDMKIVYNFNDGTTSVHEIETLQKDPRFNGESGLYPDSRDWLASIDFTDTNETYYNNPCNISIPLSSVSTKIPKVIDFNDQIVDSTMVNYANVYLYGTDGVLLHTDIDKKVIDPFNNSLPYVTMPVTYFNNFTEKAIISGTTVFSSVADIETVYPPVVFSKEGVDLTNINLVKTFFEANITPLSDVAPVRWAVAQLDDFEIGDVYTSLDNANTEPITSDGMYQVGMLVTDKDGNVGLELLESEYTEVQQQITFRTLCLNNKLLEGTYVSTELTYGYSVMSWGTSFNTGSITENVTHAPTWVYQHSVDGGYSILVFDITEYDVFSTQMTIISSATTNGINITIELSSDNGLSWSYLTNNGLEFNNVNIVYNTIKTITDHNITPFNQMKLTVGDNSSHNNDHFIYYNTEFKITEKINPIFKSVSTLQTSITSAEFTDQGLIISGEVIADENNETSFYAIATTKQLTSDIDAIGLFETYENAKITVSPPQGPYQLWVYMLNPDGNSTNNNNLFAILLYDTYNALPGSSGDYTTEYGTRLSYTTLLYDSSTADSERQWDELLNSTSVGNSAFSDNKAGTGNPVIKLGDISGDLKSVYITWTRLNYAWNFRFALMDSTGTVELASYEDTSMSALTGDGDLTSIATALAANHGKWNIPSLYDASSISIPKIIDINNNIVDSTAVNYANVYLYGTDGTPLHDDIDKNTVVPITSSVEWNASAKYWRVQIHSYTDSALSGKLITVKDKASTRAPRFTELQLTESDGVYVPLVLDVAVNGIVSSTYNRVHNNVFSPQSSEQFNHLTPKGPMTLDYVYNSAKTMTIMNIGSTDVQEMGFPVDMTIYNKQNDGDPWIKHSTISYNKGSLLDQNDNVIDIPIGFSYYKQTVKFDMNRYLWYFDSYTHLDGTGGNIYTIEIPEDNTVVPYEPIQRMDKPHVTIKNTYFNNITEKATISGITVFSSDADIDVVYPPVVFKGTVELTDNNLLKSFIETNSTPLSGVGAVKLAVETLPDFEEDNAYVSLDNTDTEPIDVNVHYRVCIIVVDTAGNEAIHIENYTFPLLSNIRSTILSTEFTSEGLQMSGDVLADETNQTTYYAIATTKQITSDTEAIQLINTHKDNAELVVSDEVGSVSKIEIDGNMYDTTIDDVTDADNGKTPWILVLNYIHKHDTTPQSTVRNVTDGLPVLPTDGSLDFNNVYVKVDGVENPDFPEGKPGQASWGHASNELFDKLCKYLGSELNDENGIELRFVAKTSSHDRVAHFKTKHKLLIEGFRYGQHVKPTFDSTTWAQDYTLYDSASGYADVEPQHSATYIPQSVDMLINTGGDSSMLFSMKYNANAYFWVGYDGAQAVYEIDEYLHGTAGAADDDNTYHQIWVRADRLSGTTLTNMSIPKVIDINDNVVDSSAVNYAKVYLYGTDGTPLHDDIDTRIVYPPESVNNLPHVTISSVSEVVVNNELIISGTVFSSVANITDTKVAVFDPAFDLVDADQAALTSFVNTNGTDLGVTSVQYAVGAFTDFVMNVGYYTDLSGGSTTPLVNGNFYNVVVSASDGTNVSVEKHIIPFKGAIAFHHDSFTNSSNKYNIVDSASASTKGYIFSDISPRKYDWGEIISVNYDSTKTTYEFVPKNEMNAHILMVAGGGSGARCYHGGGGGAGGYVFYPSTQLNSTVTVIVGNGGNNSNGYNTSITDLEVAIGGGRGGTDCAKPGPGLSGGSGGGATGYSGASGGGSISGQGHRGGNGHSGRLSGERNIGAGGGGAGGAGQNESSGGHGGIGLKEVTKDGITYNFTDIFDGAIYGHVVNNESWFAGGGGGGGWSTNGGNGGLGGASRGANNTSPALHALPHTGGGGGGEGYQGKGYYGKGGSGVVIMKVL